METKKTFKPMKMSEMLPYLKGIMSKEDIQNYSEQYIPPPLMSTTPSSEIIYKPLTIAELSTVIERLNPHSSKKSVQASSARKKKWNTSVKVDNKKINRTQNGQMRYNPVRKMLDVTSHSQIATTSRTPMNSETPKFPRPEYKAKKTLSLLDRNNVRVSGVCAIPETPHINIPIKKSRQTLVNKEKIPRPIKKTRPTLVNKENIPKPQYANIIIDPATPEISTCKKLIIYDTPQLKEICLSGSDDSFLQREKEVEEQAVEKNNVNLLSMSTPFKDFKGANNFFNDSTHFNNSELHENDTIMSVDKEPREENKREETVIVSLCNLLNKANLTDSKSERTELNDLVESEKRSMAKIEMIEKIIKTLNEMKELELKSLENVRKLIEQRNSKKTTVDKIVNSDNTKSLIADKHCSVIKTSGKSPSYRIPKNSSLRKVLISKSMPNVSNMQLSPRNGMNEKALSMYMTMKKHVTFLNTPVKSERKALVPETPSAAITSLNLQRQLDKLYDE